MRTRFEISGLSCSKAWHDLGRAYVSRGRNARGSTLIIVLWIAFGLVSLALYFAQAMTYELRAADNRVCGLAADQAIDGAARYLTYILANWQTNGLMPDPTTYLNEAVPIGNSRVNGDERSLPHFWLIGRVTNQLANADGISFGLVDEASKINLNLPASVTLSNLLEYVPNMNLDLLTAILDWSNTNGGTGAYDTYYGMNNLPYQNKCAAFETVDELRLLYGSDLYTLYGQDLNRNGILDPNEGNSKLLGSDIFGVLEYVTVYSREPNTYSNGLPRININPVDRNGLENLLRTTLGSRAEPILGRLAQTPNFPSPLQFYRQSGMTLEDFGQIARALTTVAGPTNFIVGRINVNTASATVLACLPGLNQNPDLAETLVSYREQNPDQLTSVAWVVEALGQNNAEVLQALAAQDCITTESYQFTADVAALGPYGRGYRRVRFVFDTSEGTPQIIYRQDLTHLGWALGQQVRQEWVGTPSQFAARWPFERKAF